MLTGPSLLLKPIIGLSGALAPGRLGGRVGLGRLGYGLSGAIALLWFGLVWVAVNGAPALSPVAYGLSGGAGLTACLLGMLVLDHRCRKAEKAERHALDMYGVLSQALDAVPVSVHIKDADLRYVWVGAQHEHQTGYSAAEMLGKTIGEIDFYPASADVVTSHDRRVLETGEAGEPQEQVIQRRDGQLKSISLITKVPLLRDGKVTHIVSLAAEQRHWREAQMRAEEVRRLLETVLDAAPIIVQVADRDFRLCWVNRAFCDHIGWKTGSPIGKTLYEVAPDPNRWPETLAAHHALLEGRQTMVRLNLHFPATAYRPEQYLLVTKMAIHDATGAVTQVLTMATDVTASVHAEAAAEIANRLVEGLLRNVPLSIQVKDANLRYCWANTAFSETIGQDAAAILGKTLDDFAVAADIKQQSHDLDRKVLASGETTQSDQQWIFGGAAHQMMVIKTPLLDATGHATHVITIAADITELHRLQAEVDASRRQLQAVLDAVPVTLALKDTDRRYLWVNHVFENIFGYSADSVRGRRIEEIVDDKVLPAQIAKADAAVLQTNVETHLMTQRHLSSEGRVTDLSVSRHVVRDADGKIGGVLVVGVEVTELLRTAVELQRINEELEQRVAERAGELAKVNAFVATMIDRAPVPIIAVDLDGRIRSWNPAAVWATGYAEAEALGRSALVLLPDEHAQVANLLGFMRRGIFASNIEIRCKRRDGKSRDYLVSGAPMTQEDGTVDGAITIWLDITEQRVAERQLHQAQKMEAIGQLTGNVAHDFNNFLAVVIGNLDLLLDVLPTEALERKLVNDAIDAAERGAALNRQLLAFARQQTLHPVTLNLVSLINGMRPLLQRAVGELVVIRYVGGSDPWLTRVDPVQLESAILNLSVNARDAMPTGGTLTIAAHNVTSDEVYTTLQADADATDYVCVSVSDTGTGIAPEVLGHVFEPFFTTKRTGKGTGLGLSIVYGFVKQSGGHVHVSSEIGHGTCIRMYLPRVTARIEQDAADNVITSSYLGT